MKDRASDAMQSAAIYDHFRALIVTGRLGQGEQLPTVGRTAKELGVDYGTAAGAYEQLEQVGLVVTRTGVGAEVSADASPLPVSVVGLVRALAKLTIQTHTDPHDVLVSLLAELR